VEKAGKGISHHLAPYQCVTSATMSSTSTGTRYLGILVSGCALPISTLQCGLIGQRIVNRGMR
jgi:hypothetical protein